MATAKIEAAIAAIPEKKESLRRALEDLRTHLSSSSFPFSVPEWNDLDAHISSVEATIRLRLQDLQAKEASKPTSSSPFPEFKERPSNEPEAVPRPELKSLCVNMDGKGLVSFVAHNRKDLAAILNELTPALRSAPDPAKLVLDALELFFSAPSPSPKSDKKGEIDVETLATKRTCINLLERIPEIRPAIELPVKNRAKTLAAEWKGKVTEAGRNNGLEIIGLLQLISAYGLVSEFKLDEILDLLLVISRRKQAVDLCRSLGLTEHVPDLIEKLNKNGRQFDAVRLVYAFNLVDKYPPVPLLRSYIKEVKKTAQDVRNKGKNSSESENVAISKELGALKCVLKTVEEYKLEAQYPREFLDKQIAKLEKLKEHKKRTSASAASNSKTQQHPNKRPRPFANAARQNLPSGMITQPRFGVADQSPHMGLAGAYGFAATGNLHNNLPGYQNSPRSYLYSSGSLIAGTGAGLYERPINYSGYPRVGMPPSYNSSLYP
ncbi:truncated FRIGIDA-like protein 1 [Canna indica]|uniref:FRIGIDA-like protein n=1 Tax=Canna indica TaxID=4628 RepID=A0AAQ3KZU9_9LILI|nr:truncated FRIGIDA-like protein 1 [Canna indica]